MYLYILSPNSNSINNYYCEFMQALLQLNVTDMLQFFMLSTNYIRNACCMHHTDYITEYCNIQNYDKYYTL